MDNRADLQQILNAINTLSTKDKTQLIERVAVNLKQELIAQNLVPRKSLKGLWHNSNTIDGLILSAKHLNRVTHLKPNNTRLFQKLEAATVDLLFYSEDEHPFETFIWEIDKQGSFNLTDFLLDTGFVKPITEEDFFNLIKPADISFEDDTIAEIESEKARTEQIEAFQQIQGYQTRILSLLKSQSETVEIFRFEIWEQYDPIVYEAFDFVVAKLNNTNWLGFTPLIDGMSSYLKNGDFPWIPGEIIPLSEPQNIQPKTLELRQQVREILDNNQFPIIQYYGKGTTKEFIVEVAESKNSLITRLLHNSGSAKATSWEKFGNYHSDCTDKAEEKRLVRYQNLDRLLESNLKNIKEYVMGSMADYYIYVIGETQTGDYLGVSTIVVHT